MSKKPTPDSTADAEVSASDADIRAVIGAMPEYRSHKVVRAAAVVFIGAFHLVVMVDGESRELPVGEDWIQNRITERSEGELGVFLAYPDGYTSWSPQAAFRDGYTPVEPPSAPEPPGPPELPAEGESAKLLRNVARAMHESGRAAVVDGQTVAQQRGWQKGSRFVEWDDLSAPERDGRLSMAREFLRRYEVRNRS